MNYHSNVRGFEGECEKCDYQSVITTYFRWDDNTGISFAEAICIMTKYPIMRFKRKIGETGLIFKEPKYEFFYGYFKDGEVYDLKKFDHVKENTLLGRIIVLEEKIKLLNEKI